MGFLGRHFSRCFLAGIVALLPIAGLVASVVYLEYTISRSWLSQQPWYFPGLGIVFVILAVYLIGLVISTFLGQLLWRTVEKLLKSMPVLGPLYTTLQQILGYGEGPGALFEKVVLVPSRETGAWELGLVTRQVHKEGGEQLVVFVPGAPNPMAGRLIVIPSAVTQAVPMSVNDAMRALVAVGKSGTERLTG